MDPKDKIAFINNLNNNTTPPKASEKPQEPEESEVSEPTKPVASEMTKTTETPETSTTASIFCTNCGQKIPTDSKFCVNCGSPVKVVPNNMTTTATPTNNTLTNQGTALPQAPEESILQPPQKVTITAEKREPTKRYTSTIINTNISDIIKTMAENNASMIAAVEQAQRDAALANGLANWDIEPPITIIRRQQ
ncbi:zinc ribbon domain-containing protein [Veillonella atypica]|uniref:zinc ribbon domain-containing protein n=1 Tax=Veillonella atypica TaxID=39777 RepID=UPI00352F1D6B